MSQIRGFNGSMVRLSFAGETQDASGFDPDSHFPARLVLQLGGGLDQGGLQGSCRPTAAETSSRPVPFLHDRFLIPLRTETRKAAEWESGPDSEIPDPSKIQLLFSEVEPQREKVATQRGVWLSDPV
jgi:hypothetical protein